MQRIETNASAASGNLGLYSHAVGISGFQNLVFFSGQTPLDANGELAPDFSGQARQVWRNIQHQLFEQGLGLGDIIKLTIFLRSRADIAENRALLAQALGANKPAMSLIICDLIDENWMLEIEGVAVK